MKQYTILTKNGLNKLISASANQTTITLKEMAVGDGSGEINQDATALQSERHRFAINAITINQNDSNILEVEGVLQADIGGFYVREAGIFCDDGSLFAVAKVAESYKPLLAEGSAKDITISFQIQISNTSLINLKVDNNVVLATRKWVLASNYTKEEIDEKLKGIDSYPIGAYILWSSEAKTPAGFLKADGRSLKKAEYQELHAIIGYTYGGSGDNFNIPNFSDGKFIRSVGGNALALGQAQQDAIRNIVGNISSFINGAIGAEDTSNPFYKRKAEGTPSGISGGGAWTATAVSMDLSKSVPTANENRPYNSSVVVLIKAKNVKEPTSLPDATIYATETKAGIVKIKNSINGNAEDMAVTEKAVKIYVDNKQQPSLGIGQTWQDVTNERQVGMIYTNSTGKPIYVSIITSAGQGVVVSIEVDGKVVSLGGYATGHGNDGCSTVVPNGSKYKLVGNGSGFSKWHELR